MTNLKISVIDKSGKISGEENGSPEVFGVKFSPVLVSQAVRKFLTNQRHALGKVKTRGDVIGSTAKIWKQKGTGRARHGSRKANIFVGGGVSHGPTGLQNYSQGLNKKMSQKVIKGILSAKLKNKNLFIIEDLPIKKTKDANIFLKETIKNLSLKGKIALICNQSEEIRKYFGNLKDVEIFNVNSLNGYELLLIDNILITKKSLTILNKLIKIEEKTKETKAEPKKVAPKAVKTKSKTIKKETKKTLIKEK